MNGSETTSKGSDCATLCITPVLLSLQLHSGFYIACVTVQHGSCIVDCAAAGRNRCAGVVADCEHGCKHLDDLAERPLVLRL